MNELKCARCKIKIIKTENYCRFTEWLNNVQRSEAYYHKKCFMEGIALVIEKDEVTKKASSFLDKANELVSRMG